ncbi:uncharacterized protein LOC116308549 [Actinia tenebrosa]|uniref:Uncharacterized protein LOC116308549 n=1 Tax=Actinia tenebrosa TaxID=6105 RepID=A0A6P8J5B2_ACTTE|nr:uncharacterized protein LOC116308549 [Actinia tenebrosa]
MKKVSITNVFHPKSWIRSATFLILTTFFTAAKAQDGNVSVIRDWPGPNPEANAGTSIDFTWRYTLTKQDKEHLDKINFGLCFKEKLKESLITVTKLVENNSTKFQFNVTEKYEKRLRWVGAEGKISFKLSNLTKEDTNSYIMVMSFGSTREPISDHVEFVVNYAPRILNKPPEMRQVRLPEGESVHISCTITSCPLAVVTWSKEGRVIQSQSKEHDLTIQKGRVIDSGVYTCEAKNKLGEDKMQVLVIVTSCKELKSDASKNTDPDQSLHDANDPSTLFTMIAPAVVFFVIFLAYFAFKCPAYRNRKKRNRALLNSKATSTSLTNTDEQATSLLADWSNFSDRGEKV